MITTAAGAAMSFWFAGGLLKSFSTGLFATDAPLDAPFFVAVLGGAFGWVVLATWSGLPVSTTHAITGALTGAGLVAFGGAGFRWELLGARFALPLAVSPVLSLALVYGLAWPVVLVVARVTGRCVCLSKGTLVPAARLPGGGASAGTAEVGVVVGQDTACSRQDSAVLLSGSASANAIHWFTSGMVGFARGWNDAPKIAALGLVALTGSSGMVLGFTLVTVAMALGGLVAGRRVLDTLSTKLTALPLAESLTASLTTATLVGMASWNGLPVSTTHVSTGAIIGAGLKHDPRGVRWKKVAEIAASWVITLPVAGLLGAAFKAVLR